MTAPDRKRHPARGGASNDQHSEPSHTGDGSSTALQGFGFKWLPLPLALALAEILPKPDADAGAYFKKCLIALATRKRGECALSDSMLEDADIYSQTKREAANKRWHRDADAMHLHTGAMPNKQTNKQTDKQTVKPSSYAPRARCAGKEYPPNAKPTIL